MNISLELYKTFYYVAKNKSITRAANEMMISQPAISKSIKTLEEQLNTKLFIRNKDGVNLTEAGLIIYNKIKTAIELIYSAENDLQSYQDLNEGTLTIGTNKTILKEFLLPYINEFHKKYPKIKIRIKSGITSKKIEMLETGLIDILFINMPYQLQDTITTKKMKTMHNCFLASEEFKELKGKEISLKELVNYPLITLNDGSSARKFYDELFQKNNLYPKNQIEVSGYNISLELTKIGLGLGFLIKEISDQDIKSGDLFEIKIKENLPLRELHYAYYNKNDINPVTKKFIEIIEN